MRILTEFKKQKHKMAGVLNNCVRLGHAKYDRRGETITTRFARIVAGKCLVFLEKAGTEVQFRVVYFYFGEMARD